MIAPPTIVDTSIWIDYFAGQHGRVADLLRQRRVLIHPMIVGEIALGSIRDRSRILAELRALPPAPILADDDVTDMIELLELGGTGIGFVDAHLLAAIRRVPGGMILTRDKKLLAQALRIGVAA